MLNYHQNQENEHTRIPLLIPGQPLICFQLLWIVALQLLTVCSLRLPHDITRQCLGKPRPDGIMSVKLPWGSVPESWEPME